MPNHTYLFYDLETSGLNKSFDQVLQFAAIRTDLDFRELERHEFYVKLNPDTIPSPGASITHRISIATTTHQGLTELEAMERIHALVNTPGTISLGYNTLEFDDEFLRFSFYRNLLPPYTHQYANDCSRMDIYPIILLYYLYKPGSIKWPTIDGVVSLKLDNINQANQLVHGQAHNAMVDVEATLALTKVLALDKKMWDYVCGYFNKKIDDARARQLTKAFDHHYEAVLLQGKLGAKQSFQAPALYLGEHRHYRNQTIWLRLDLESLPQTTPDTIAKNTWAISKKLGETPLLLPLADRFTQKMSSDRKNISEANKQWLQQHPELFNEIIDYHLEHKHPVYPKTDNAAALYISEFWSPEETRYCRGFHTATPNNKAKSLPQLSNPTLYDLALRVLGRFFPDTLTAAQQLTFQHYLDSIYKPHNPPHDFRGEAHITPEKALTEISKLKTERALDSEQLALLVEIEAYLN